MATAVLSKRWRSMWKRLPKLMYKDTRKGVWWFLCKSLQLHNAPLEVDVVKWVDMVVEQQCIQWLDINLLWSAEPTSCIQWLYINLFLSAQPRSLSKSLYTCKTLKKLNLSNNILVDVPSEASLPSLVELKLFNVVYNDEDSVVRLVSSCHVLQNLYVDRTKNDNVINFRVKVPSLRLLRYTHPSVYGAIDGSLVIDSPGLKIVTIYDFSGDAWLIENMPPCLNMAKVFIGSQPNDIFLSSLSSVMYLSLKWIQEMDAICGAINFSRLIECKLTPCYSMISSIMDLLYNSPNLKVLMINPKYIREPEDLPHWSPAPGCLSYHLEIFEWEEYKGKLKEKTLLTYILANSKCLKTAGISLRSSYEDEKKKMIMEELKSLYRVSTSCQLLFSTQFTWRSMKHPNL